MLGHNLKLLGRPLLCAGAWLRHWTAPRQTAGQARNYDDQNGYQVPSLTESVPFSPIPFSDQDSYKFVAFDLETTGLGRGTEICQIAAAEVKPNAPVWSKYILPKSNIDESTSMYHGLTIEMVSGKRCLFNEGNPVEALDLEDVMTSFLAYLQQQSRDVSRTILVAHNAFYFDVPILLCSLDKCGINAEQLDSLGIGFADSLRLLRKLKAGKHPPLLHEGEPLQSLSVSSIYLQLFKEEEPYDEGGKGVKDVKALCSILSYLPLAVTPAQLLKHSTTAMSAWRMAMSLERKYELLSTLTSLYSPVDGEPVITRYMATKIAGSGLGFNDLEQIWRRYGRNGLATVFAAPRPLKRTQLYPEARVTRTKRIIDAVAGYFQGLQN